MINKLLEKEKYSFLVFIIFIIIGILTFKDFGLSIDDEYYRSNGIFYKDFIKSFFSLLLNFNFSDLEILKKEIETNSLLNHPAIFKHCWLLLQIYLKFMKLRIFMNHLLIN